ncbi:MAG: glycosyltransferase family 2 protein [Desulfobacteraceae bacterium]|nr:MAG: glycosyltransferase family 2 protein [Desulfobacteraceae bacterium]
MLSVVIAAKNESAHIEKCIRSVLFADEIIVVDDFSTDETVAIARGLNARVMARDSRGVFHENKNWGIAKAAGDWIFSLDADETVSPELARSIQAAIARPEADGYRISRRNYFLGQWIKGSGWYPEYILRLFRKGQAQWPLEIHDTPKLAQGNQAAPVLEGPLLHDSYQTFEQYFDKFNRYTTRLSAEYQEQNISMQGIHGIVNLFLRPAFWFIKKYIFKMGFRDGLFGFFVSFSSALVIFVSYLKLRQRRKIN